jgi:phosphonate transport system substrate-binding protein
MSAMVQLLYRTLFALALFVPLMAAAADRARAGGEPLVFAISEGTSGVQDGAEIFVKYDELLAYLSRAMGKRVTLQVARDVKWLDAAMQAGRLDFVMVSPTDYAARAIRDYGYQLVATTKGDGFLMAIVKRDTQVESIKDIVGKRVALPHDTSYAGRMAVAMLRDAGVDVRKLSNVSYQRDEAVIGYAVQQGMADVGFVASFSSVGRQWQQKGGRVLARGPLQPYNPVVASPSVSAADVARLRGALLVLDRNDEGKAILARIGLPGFAERAAEDLIKTLKWLGD